MLKPAPSCAARCSGFAPAVIVTTTAFAAGGEGEAVRRSTALDAPVLQAVIATTRRAAWQESPRGLGAADLAMHVVLPELDGRVLAGAIAFKDALPSDDCARLHRLREPARAGPRRHRGRSDRRAGALAAQRRARERDRAC